MDGRCLQAPTWTLNKQQPVRLVCINFIFLIMNSFNTQAQIITLSPLCFAVYILQLVLMFSQRPLYTFCAYLGRTILPHHLLDCFPFIFYRLIAQLMKMPCYCLGIKTIIQQASSGQRRRFCCRNVGVKKSSF